MSSDGGSREFIRSVVATLVIGLGCLTTLTVLLNRAETPSPTRPAQRVALLQAAATAGHSATGRVRIPTTLPFGDGPIFPGHTLVAYYGTAGTGSLGVLGEDTPDRITRRLRKAAAPFARPGRPVQIVYELIVTVADPHPGPDGDFSHDIAREKVATYIRAAHRNKALLILDLQPGRSDFLTVAKRWKWALKDPWVGLALDPEWRMGPDQVPAQVIGSVGAREVNRVSKWLHGVQVNHDLLEKVFMLHTFRTAMIRNIQDVVRRPGLAMVEHVDGFGTQAQKLNTYHAVARPKQFTMGFKLFYDEDVNLMSPARVKQIRPVVRFVSYQ